MSLRRSSFGALLVVGLLAGAAPAGAQEDTLRLNNDPIGYTDVIDAFDEGDPFDLNVHVGFRRSRVAGTIQREGSLDPDIAGSGRGSQNFQDIGDWEHTRNILELGVDIGVFKDVMLFGRLPLVLRDSRRILTPGSSNFDEVNGALAEPLPETPMPGTQPQLYYMPFESPTRSGLDRFEFGIAFDLLNQARDRHHPTWMLLLALDMGIGDRINACERDQVRRNPTTGEPVDPAESVECDPGLSDGTHAFRLESRLSKRFAHLAVYSGLHFRFAWPGRAESQFRPGGDLAGYQNNLPPVRGGLTLGMAIIPWENRATWQRFSIDFRVDGTYVSEGRDYSPLYDAFGSSQHPYLTEPNYEGIPDRAAVLNEVRFNGLTDVQAHGVFRGTFAVEMQAAKYVRFRVGTTLSYTTAHILTYTDSCNPNADPSGPTDPRIGRCAEGLLNPHHRPVLDTPGQRFRLDGAMGLDIFVRAVGQF